LRARRSGVAGRVALATAAVALALAAGELALRATGRPFTGQYRAPGNRLARFDAELGWSYLPDHSAVQPYGTEKRPVAIHFDAIGSRVPTPGLQRDPAAPSLLLIGGSYAMGHGVPYEESLAGQLERLAGFPYQVVSLGVQGYGTDQALLALERHGARFDTRAVVYLFIPDHLVRNAIADRRLVAPRVRFVGTKPRFALDGDGRPFVSEPPARYEELGGSRLLDLARVLWVRFGPPPGLALTRALLLRMKESAEALGARFVVIRWTGGERITEPPAALFGGLEAHLVDTDVDRPPDWNEWRIPGDGHPDARAYAHVAPRVAARLAALEDPAGMKEDGG